MCLVMMVFRPPLASFASRARDRNPRSKHPLRSASRPNDPSSRLSGRRTHERKLRSKKEKQVPEETVLGRPDDHNETRKMGRTAISPAGRFLGRQVLSVYAVLQVRDSRDLATQLARKKSLDFGIAAVKRRKLRDVGISDVGGAPVPIFPPLVGSLFCAVLCLLFCSFPSFPFTSPSLGPLVHKVPVFHAHLALLISKPIF